MATFPATRPAFSDAMPRTLSVESAPMAGPVFTGVGVALVTLFRDDGEVDAAATAEHAAQLVDLGIKAVVVAGSTGEAASLSLEDRGPCCRRCATP